MSVLFWSAGGEMEWTGGMEKEGGRGEDER